MYIKIYGTAMICGKLSFEINLNRLRHNKITLIAFRLSNLKITIPLSFSDRNPESRALPYFGLCNFDITVMVFFNHPFSQ